MDEAHNFRNLNRRSMGLREYLEAGDHKVVLLSATPQNLGPMDIYRQLRLFLDDTEHGLPLEPLNLESYFSNAQKWIEYRVAYENYRAEFETWETRPSDANASGWRRANRLCPGPTSSRSWGPSSSVAGGATFGTSTATQRP